MSKMRAPAPDLRRDLDRLRRAQATAAELTLADPVYAPIFARLDAELEAAEAAMATDPITRARAVARQRAIASTTL